MTDEEFSKMINEQIESNSDLDTLCRTCVSRFICVAVSTHKTECNYYKEDK